MVRLLVGIGSPHGDDVAGWAVADQLSRHPNLPDDIEIRQAQVPIDVLNWLEEAVALHVCDSCLCGAHPGTLHHWKLAAEMDSWPSVIMNCACFRSSGSHSWGLADVLSLAGKLRILPTVVDLWGIEGRCFRAGDPISPEVLIAVAETAAKIRTAFN